MGARPGSGSGRRRGGPGSAVDLVLRSLSLAGLVVLALTAGSWVAHRDLFPYRDHLSKAFVGADAFLRSLTDDADDGFPPPKPGRGEWLFDVAAADRDRAAEGLTLISYGQKAELVDLDGRVRHAWHVDFRRVLPEEVYRREGQRPGGVVWRAVRLLPGGDLLVILEARGVTPYSLALVRLDRDSRPGFHHVGAHHDLDVAPDGRILVLVNRIRTTVVPGLRSFRPPLFDELLVELSAEGELLREFSLAAALVGTPFTPMVNKEVSRLRYETGDYLHPNNVDLVDADTAARFPFAREGQVLLSFRELNALAMLDPGSGKVTWMRRGEWVRQHDPDFLPNGNLLIFDNLGDLDRRGGSRVIEYDPRSRAVVWQYPSAEGHRDVRTRGKGDSQRLPNGNTLVNSYYQGWLFEVTRDGEIVWEGFCRIPGERRPVCGIESAMRVPAAAVDFPLNEGVVPGAPRADGARGEDDGPAVR